MTGNLVILAVKLALDKYSASTSAVIGPAFLDEELCEFANQAMIETICTKFTGNNQLQQGFELSVKRIADLEQLIVESVHKLIPSKSNKYITEAASFDDNVIRLFLVSATVSVLDKSNKELFFPAVLTDRQTVKNFLMTPINRPLIPVPRLTTSSDGITVYLDPDWEEKYSSHKLVLEYVTQPKKLDYNNLSETAFGDVFSDAVLYEIINHAALLALDNIESQRVETKAALNKIQE